MSIVFKLDGALLPYQTVRLNTEGQEGGVQGLPASAWYGEPSTASLTIEDPGGTLNIEGWHEFTVDESSCSKPRIFTGWVFGKSIHRGPYVNSAGRAWECQIIDQNALFSFVAFRASSAKRPEETDLARVAFAQASAPMHWTPAHDNGRFNTTDNPVNFGPADYVTQFPAELFNSVVGVADKNFYAYWSDADAQISLHYDLFTAGPAATISISNVLADVNNTTVFAPSRDATLERSPEKQYTGILFGYIGGQYVYGTRQATIDAIGPSDFSPDGFQRDLVYRTDRVGRTTTANALLASMLEAHSEERDEITFTVTLPASKVNLAHAGDVLTVKFSHLPGYETNTDLVIIRRGVVPTEGSDELYDVSFVCRPEGLNRGPDGGDPDDFPHENACDGGDITLVQSTSTDQDGSIDLTVTFDDTATEGNLLVVHTSYRGVSTADTVAGWNLSPLGTSTIDNDDEQSTATYYKVSDGTETDWVSNWTPNANFKRGIFAEFSGVSELTLYDEAFDVNSLVCPGGTVTVPTGTTALVVTGIGYNTGGDTNPFPYPDPTWSGGATMVLFAKNEGEHPVTAMGYQVIDPSAGSATTHVLTFSGFSPNGDESSSAQTLVFICSGSDVPPAAGMHVKDEFVGEGDGSTVLFTTRYPYAAGSLEVFVDGVPIINGLSETDPDAGTFTLDFAPEGAIGDTRAERVTVNYQANPGGPGT